MNPGKIIQIIPSTGWRVRVGSPADGFEDVVAFALRKDGKVVPLIVVDGNSIQELKSEDFSLVGPVRFDMLEQAAALQNGDYQRLRRR
jgi:hypothetical protein